MITTSSRVVFSALLLVVLSGCLGMPEKVTPVKDFDITRYLGKWHEIARLDHSFERGLERVSAEYSLREDGGVNVINRGYSTEDQRWQEAQGKAYFVEEETTGYLKVSFFGPFYGSYVVFELDHEGYEYAFVSGPDTSYLWLLAREPQVSEAVKTLFKSRTQALGFEADALIWVDQSKSPTDPAS